MAATASAATTADAAVGSNSGLQISFRVEGPKRLAKDLLLLLAEPCLLLPIAFDVCRQNPMSFACYQLLLTCAGRIQCLSRVKQCF